MSKEQRLEYVPEVADLSAEYSVNQDVSEQGYYNVFTMFDNQYQSRFSTQGQSKPHNWHMTGQNQLRYQDINGVITHGICAASRDMGHGEGMLSFGPYEFLSHGNYRADFLMFGIFPHDVPPNTVVAHIDICTNIGQTLLATRAITAGEFQGTLKNFTLTASSNAGFQNLETRLYFRGIGAIGYKKITFDRT